MQSRSSSLAGAASTQPSEAANDSSRREVGKVLDNMHAGLSTQTHMLSAPR